MITSPSPVKFLVVDDVEENLIVLEALLERDGLEILTAISGRVALEMLRVHDIALALIDVQMPEMNGLELARQMRSTERTRNIPVIFVTGGSNDRRRLAEGYDAGAVDFLFKPIDPIILKRKADMFFQLCRQREDLATTLKLNEEFVAFVGHDLRNPLNVILLTARMLAKAKEPEVQAMAERLRSSGHRMLRIIDELSDLSRARLHGGIPVRRALTRIGPLIDKVVQEHHGVRGGVEICIDGDPCGDWDQARLEQLLTNLLSSAIRHQRRDGRIAVDARTVLSDLILSVHHDGQIPPALLPTLFAPFPAEDHEAGSRPDGLGIGLYLAQQIAFSHGGDVSVASSDLDGTTISVRLPLEAPSPP